ncbi:hypothetical protein [Nonomuraea sp. C10]|uniref:hypothetical protein n=1 Tax=Nonomuraea sp. C10 TaxID=2600577 RepID=UPI0011CE88CD|nr:hypothetical protein [Nonomuraea sp. C10]TXK42758.1 hypothetical protein FR742_27140 [Nonomuraea sp. C10]
MTEGDFATTRADGPVNLVYLLRNTITNLTTQDEQVACFRDAAAHLEPGGRFVVEVYVPELRRLPPGQTVHPFTVTPEHLGFEEYDLASRIAVSHHYWVGGRAARDLLLAPSPRLAGRGVTAAQRAAASTHSSTRSASWCRASSTRSRSPVVRTSSCRPV